MAYSQPIADVLREFFVLSNIDAGFEEQAGCGVFTFRTKLHCRMQTAQMTVLVREDNFSTLTAIPLAADKNSRLAVAEYLTRVNFNMRNGNFELDMETGEIRFKTYVHVGGGRPAAATWPGRCPSSATVCSKCSSASNRRGKRSNPSNGRDEPNITKSCALRPKQGSAQLLFYGARPYALPPARSALAACLRRLFSLHACMTSASAITP